MHSRKYRILSSVSTALLPLDREGNRGPVGRAAHALRAHRRLRSLPNPEPDPPPRTIQPPWKNGSPRRRGERGGLVFQKKNLRALRASAVILLIFYSVRSKSSRPEEPGYIVTSAFRHRPS